MINFQVYLKTIITATSVATVRTLKWFFSRMSSDVSFHCRMIVCLIFTQKTNKVQRISTSDAQTIFTMFHYIHNINCIELKMAASTKYNIWKMKSQYQGIN